MTRKLTATPVACLPAGYEIHEDPLTAQVRVRKIQPSLIEPAEQHLLEETIRTHAPKVAFIVDIEKSALIVCAAHIDTDTRLALMRAFAPVDAAMEKELKADMIARASYAKMLRFTLANAQTRQFNVDRWCFLGSIDDWYPLEFDQPLAALAEKYAPHLGSESFFELM